MENYDAIKKQWDRSTCMTNIATGNTDTFTTANSGTIYLV